MQSTRQYLKNLDKPTLRKLIDLCDLTEDERWALIFVFVERRMRANICDRFGIEKTKYHSWINEILAKVEVKIRELDKVRTL